MLLVLLVVLCLFSSSYNQTYPSSVLVPSNAITDVLVTCNVSNPEWRVNGTVLTFANIPPGINPMSEGIPSLTVEKASVLRYNGTSIQCRQNDGGNWSIIPTAFIRVYGTRINCLAQYIVNQHKLVNVLYYRFPLKARCSVLRVSIRWCTGVQLVSSMGS